MKGTAVPRVWRIRVFSLALLALSLFPAAIPSQAQRKFPGRGAVSAQDLSKLTSPAAAVTGTAGSGSGQNQASVNVPITIV
jgi:anti-sigma factor RsiW